MMNQRLAIIDGIRTPFCKMGSLLAGQSADDLGKIAVSALLTRTGFDPALIDEVIFGCVAQPADAANIARVIALRAGIPQSTPAMTVHRNCASGIEAVTQAMERIAVQHGEIFLVGGAESMSHIPLLFNQRAADKFTALARAKSPLQKLAALTAMRPEDFSPRIGLKLGLTDPVCGLNMGETAEILAREFAVSREEQDAFALRSHQHAIAGREKLAEEICPVFVNGKAITQDNGPREHQTLEALAKLRPVFDPKLGTVTAGNSSQITDGAVALLVMSESRAQSLGLKPLGFVRDFCYVGCDPARMGLGPAFAIAKLQRQSAFRIENADIVEINEAFASQVLAAQKLMQSSDFLSKEKVTISEIPDEKLNVNGGAIALGHPVGATGSRLILTSLKELQRRGAKTALVALCVGGGQGAAVWLERD